MTTQDPASGGRTRRVTVTHGRNGWEVMELRDDKVVRRARYTDWHRVERAVGRFDLSCEAHLLLGDRLDDRERG